MDAVLQAIARLDTPRGPEGDAVEVPPDRCHESSVLSSHALPLGGGTGGCRFDVLRSPIGWLLEVATRQNVLVGSIVKIWQYLTVPSMVPAAF